MAILARFSPSLLIGDRANEKIGLPQIIEILATYSVVMLKCLIVHSIFSTNSLSQELPQSLLSQLHLNLKIAAVLDYNFTGYRNLPIKYYKVDEINIRQLEHIFKYDVLILERRLEIGYQARLLSSEHIDIIVNFVQNGGGLIIHYGHGDDITMLLRKLGIFITRTDAVSFETRLLVEKRWINAHPITTGVEAISAWVINYVTSVSTDGDIVISYPFVVVAKTYGSGRVVFLGDGHKIEGGLSGLRFMTNIIEWVAGYTPPGWVPQSATTTSTLREQLEQVQRNLEDLQRREKALQNELAALKREMKNLEDENRSLRLKIAEAEQIKSEYLKLKDVDRQLKVYKAMAISAFSIIAISGLTWVLTHYKKLNQRLRL